ncbi:uncharacterized protein [Montipora foliosa]|uniref:uncharacterized protein n=1 Tax=Montipora foliosa TaxID=591990 RepID=UPI0035F11932
MVGLVKAALNKTVGNSLLTWAEREEILLDVEVKLNNRPCLTLMKTSNFHSSRQILSCSPNQTRCQSVSLSTARTVTSAREPERHQFKHKNGHVHGTRGDVVIIKSEEKNRGQWKLGIIEELITGQDGVVRGDKLRESKSILETPVQLLYPLELTNERPPRRPNVDLDPRAPAFRPAFRRNAAAVARVCIQDIAQDEQ